MSMSVVYPLVSLLWLFSKCTKRPHSLCNGWNFEAAQASYCGLGFSTVELYSRSGSYHHAALCVVVLPSWSSVVLERSAFMTIKFFEKLILFMFSHVSCAFFRAEHKLFIGMLPNSVSEADVTNIFLKFGRIKELSVIKGSQPSSKGAEIPSLSPFLFSASVCILLLWKPRQLCIHILNFGALGCISYS